MNQQSLRSIRLNKGRTLCDQALAAGVAPSAISRLERGFHLPRPTNVERIATSYGLKPDELYALAIFAKNAKKDDPQEESDGGVLSSVRNIAQMMDESAGEGLVRS